VTAVDARVHYPAFPLKKLRFFRTAYSYRNGKDFDFFALRADKLCGVASICGRAFDATMQKSRLNKQADSKSYRPHLGSLSRKGPENMALRVFKAVASFAKPRIFSLSAGSPGGFQWQTVRNSSSSEMRTAESCVDVRSFEGALPMSCCTETSLSFVAPS
jgi:hypothetical protein